MTTDRLGQSTFPCRTCGADVPGFVGQEPLPDGIRCAACSDFESRLEDYLRRGGQKALQFVMRTASEARLRALRVDGRRRAHREARG